MKKLLSILLVMTLALGMTTFAFAEETTTNEEANTEETSDVTDPESEQVEEPLTEEEEEELLDELAYVTVKSDENMTLVVLDGMVVDVIEEPAHEEPATEEPVTEDPEESLHEYIGQDLIEVINLIADATEEELEIEIQASDSLAQELYLLISKNFDDIKVDFDSEDEENPNAERFALAKALDITNGKANLLEKLNVASDMDIDFEEWATASVKDIMKSIKDKRMAEKFADEEPEATDQPEDVEDDEQEDETVEAVDQEPAQTNGKSNNGKAKGKK